MKMFYGCEGSGTDKKMGDGFVSEILISAASLWNGKKFKNFKPPRYNELFLDSGGFSFFYKAGDYPFSLQEYSELARKLNAEYVAIRDYPCEPDVKRIEGKTTNKERIDATINNAKECMKIQDINWVMVVQGYNESEYQYCCDRIKEEGLETPLMAIGSLCVRKKTREARGIISRVRRNFPDNGLHGFGIDLKFIKDNVIKASLYSADTQAWKWNNRNQDPHRGILPKSEADKLENYKFYKKKIDRLINDRSESLKNFGDE